MLGLSIEFLIIFAVEVLMVHVAFGIFVCAWWSAGDWLKIIVVKVHCFVLRDFILLGELIGVNLAEGGCLGSYQNE